MTSGAGSDRATVPKTWISDRVQRLLPATIMRYVAVDPDDPRRWLGGSERGLWITHDRGKNWADVEFPEGGSPQILRFVRPREAALAGIYLATDDGIWRTSGGTLEPERVALEGRHIVSLAHGARPGELIGIDNHERIFTLDPAAPDSVEWIDVDDVTVTGLKDSVSLYSFVFDLHFGYGLFGRTASTLINDLGGLGLIVLALTGVLFWWYPRRWRRVRGGPPTTARRRLLAWLYRFHAPVIGLAALIPILYLSATGILLNHVYGFIEWGRDIPVERSSLPPVYRYASLAGELDQVLAHPGEPSHLTVVTRLGVLTSADGGRSWTADPVIGAESGQLLRAGSTEVFSNNGGTHRIRENGGTWRPIEGPRTMVSDALYVGDTLHLKNSKGFYRRSAPGEFELTDIGSPKLGGATFYMFMVDLHTGNTFHPQFKWISDFIAILAILLVLSGPILWWREKWR